MNKYRVHIRRKDGFPFNVNEIKGALKNPKSSRWLGTGWDKDRVVAEGLFYVTGQEEAVMRVYAEAKRNLDARRYSVTLELPGKEER